MDDMLNQARHLLATDPKLADLQVREESGELHLLRGDDCFARLIPGELEGAWRMEVFRNLERWECLDFQGTLEECLVFLTENPHYLFWEG
jgi:hypothetical protein